MESFLMILLTLDARTGEAVHAAAVGPTYHSMDACVHAAIDRGPLRSKGHNARTLVCHAASGHLPGARAKKSHGG